MSITKAEIARRQLGAALSLYLARRLRSCIGGEIAEALVGQADQPKFRSFALKSYPEMTDASYTALTNQFWNAFKHATHRKGRDRDDTALLLDFNEHENEIRLFKAGRIMGKRWGKLPIAAQVFNTWFLALDLSKIVDPELQGFSAGLERTFVHGSDKICVA